MPGSPTLGRADRRRPPPGVMHAEPHPHRREGDGERRRREEHLLQAVKGLIDPGRRRLVAGQVEERLRGGGARVPYTARTASSALIVPAEAPVTSLSERIGVL